MMIATVTGTLFATRKHARFEGKKILVVREEVPAPDSASERTHTGPTFLAIDRVSAGVGDRVLINKEGSSARLLFGDEEIPVQAVVVGVVDSVDLPELPPSPLASANGKTKS